MMIPRKLANLPEGPRPMKRKVKSSPSVIDAEKPIKKPVKKRGLS